MKRKIAQMINKRSRTSHFCQAEIAPLPYRWWQADVFLIKVKLFYLKVLKNNGKYGTMLL